MDDYFIGPESFDLHLISNSRNVYTNDNGSFNFILNRSMEFSGPWEIGVKQIILKSPMYIPKTDILYTSEAKIDVFDKTFTVPEGTIDTFLENINKSVPQELKDNLSFSYDKENYLTFDIKNTKLKFKSSYITDIFGLDSKTEYNTSNNKSYKNIILPHSIFQIKTDITVPGSEILYMDVLSQEKSFISYTPHNITYCRLLRNFISSININICDINNTKYMFTHPIIIILNFKKVTCF